MKYKLVTGVFLALLSSPCLGAINLVVAPWGSGDGQYGALFLPEGGRRGPQSLCVAEEDGRLFVLDTFNGGRVVIYNPKGDLLGQIPNEFPSASYGEIEVEAGRFLFLLDVSRHAINKIDLRTGAQHFQSSKVLGASGAIQFLGKDLQGKAFIRDSSGRDIALDRGYDAPLLALEVQDTDKLKEKQVGWRNTRIKFPVSESGAIQTVRFLGQLTTGEVFLGVEIRKGKLYQWRVSRYHPDGWCRERRFRRASLSPLRYRKPVAIDRAGNVYELLCTNENVRILKRDASEEQLQ